MSANLPVSGVATSDWKSTACILCECNYGVEVQLGGKDGRHLVKVRGDDAHPESKGYACEKAHRLTKPLRRRSDGSFEEIDWDIAIADVAARFSAVRKEYGGDTIFYYGGGGQGNHFPAIYGNTTRAALGSVHRANALSQEKTGEFWVATKMVGFYTRADFHNCEVAFFLGKNPWMSHSIPQARVTLKRSPKTLPAA
jgi:anaerobic selenocysteine-containing dehydrogenase